jgi:alpha-L-fucosidase
MKRAVSLLLWAALAPAQNFVDIKPAPQQVAWQDLEIGVLFHFGPNSFLNQEWGDGTADPKAFNPASLDAEQWIRAAQSAGATYVVMVAKHHDGFCLWPSRQTAYSVKSSPWRNGKGDLVREVEAAARKHGLRFGVYLSPWDRHEPAYKDNQAYDKYYIRQMNELVRYGELVEWWLDGAGSEGHVYDFDRYVDTLRTYQPNTMIFADVGFLSYGDIRWVGNESGLALETNWNVIDRRGYLRWRPAEADTPLRESHWFWHPNAESRLKPLDKLLDTYHKTVGRGAQLVLGLAPDNRGLMPEVDVARLAEFGSAIRRIYGDNLALRNVSPGVEAAVDGNPDTFWSAPEGARSADILLTFKTPVTFDRAVTMEWLAEGQRVQSYAIESFEGGVWKPLCRGTTLGHKKIDLFAPTTTRQVRLHILSAAGTPRIREFQLYDGRGH